MHLYENLDIKLCFNIVGFFSITDNGNKIDLLDGTLHL